MMDLLRAGEPVIAGGYTVVPVERCRLATLELDFGGWLSGVTEPIAIVVSGPDGVTAVDMDGAAVALQPLLQELPHLWELLFPQ